MLWVAEDNKNMNRHKHAMCEMIYSRLLEIQQTGNILF